MLPLSEILGWGIVCYLLYNFVFKFLLPVAKTTRVFKEQFRNMRDQAQAGSYRQNDGHNDQGSQGHNQQTAQNASSNAKKDKPKSTEVMGEYIDFEEIK